MRTDVYNKLKALCPNNAIACDSTKNAEIDEIPTIVGEGLQYGTLTFRIRRREICLDVWNWKGELLFVRHVPRRWRLALSK